MPTYENTNNLISRTPLGIIAGAGMLPLALVKKCEQMGLPVAVVALNGSANPDDFAPHLRTSFSIGRGKSIVRFFQNNGVQNIVMIGAVRRPSFWELRPDFWTLIRAIPLLLRLRLGDDGLLRAVRKILEREGLRVQGIQTYLPDLIAAVGPMGHRIPDNDAVYDIQRGLAVARVLGLADVGQSVVVQGGIVLGVEAIEGTGALIKRCGELKRVGPGPILIKASKPDQDRDIDLPTIGPDTITAAAIAGFRGIAVQAGSTLIVDPVQVTELAEAHQLFVFGVGEGGR